jgi:hypothetical protein
MTNDNLEKVEKALDKIRDSFLFPRPELSSNLGKDATRGMLDIGYSLLYLAKEQQSEIKEPPVGTYYVTSTIDGYIKLLYARLFIRRQ